MCANCEGNWNIPINLGFHSLAHIAERSKEYDIESEANVNSAEARLCF